MLSKNQDIVNAYMLHKSDQLIRESYLNNMVFWISVVRYGLTSFPAGRKPLISWTRPSRTVATDMFSIWTFLLLNSLEAFEIKYKPNEWRITFIIKNKWFEIYIHVIIIEAQCTNSNKFCPSRSTVSLLWKNRLSL